jgi:ribosomal protein S18 acetylase RimI-like enzyme
MEMVQIIIRRATIADAVKLSAISIQTFYDTFISTCTEEDMNAFLKEYFNIKQVQLELNNENDFYYLAELNGKVVGYCRWMEDYTNFSVMKQWKSLELKRIYVLEEFHGKGVAQQLMNFVIQSAQTNQYQVVWLGVWEHNYRAQKFYEKYSFVHSGHTHDFPIGSTAQTDCWFWRFL